ncbi:hypothetical protein WJX73_000886 [Symbiochloris irregularis]|uniref:GH26 domain-containing protein n=1 Tax=Symbiochloris irregularis TaxID=706552 RepID=A0AAW1NP62_9CHLO
MTWSRVRLASTGFEPVTRKQLESRAITRSPSCARSGARIVGGCRDAMRSGAVLSCAMCMALCLGAGHCQTPFEPKQGGWFGVSFDFTSMSVQQYTQQAGIYPAVWNIYVTLPMDGNSTTVLNTALPQLAAIKALVHLTVEPQSGLAAVTYPAIGKLAYYIKNAQLGGASFLINFGHEMNGDWYVWGQQPTQYVQTYQFVARALNEMTCGVAMVWAPNAAKGYPWREANGVSPTGWGAAPGSADWAVMDTNGDGTVNQMDDALMPYWPGDDNVSWVGMAAYSWGPGSAPFTVNSLPAAQQFTTMVDPPPVCRCKRINDYNVANSSLYSRFSADGVHNKPMIITETSALYIPSNPDGNTNYQIKSAWWQQAYNTGKDTEEALSLAEHYPQLKMVLWFDEIKAEGSAGGNVVDWRFSADPQIRAGFTEYVINQLTDSGAQYWGDLDAFQQSSLASAFTCPAGPGK